MKTEITYLGRSNITTIGIEDSDVITKIDIAAADKVELLIEETDGTPVHTAASDDGTDGPLIDYTTGAIEAQLGLIASAQSIGAGEYLVKCVDYQPGDTAGRRWPAFTLQLDAT